MYGLYYEVRNHTMMKSNLKIRLNLNLNVHFVIKCITVYSHGIFCFFSVNLNVSL